MQWAAMAGGDGVSLQVDGREKFRLRRMRASALAAVALPDAPRASRRVPGAPSRNCPPASPSPAACIALQLLLSRLLHKPASLCTTHPLQLALLGARQLLRVHLGPSTGKTLPIRALLLEWVPHWALASLRVHVSRALLAQNPARDLPHTKTNQRLPLLPSTHTLVQPRLSTSPSPPRTRTPRLCTLELDLSHRCLPPGAAIQGFVALHHHRHLIACTRHISCWACQSSQTPARSVLSSPSHTSVCVFGALAVLSTSTLDAFLLLHALSWTPR